MSLKPISTPTQFSTLPPPWQLTLLDAYNNLVMSILNDMATYQNYMLDSSALPNSIVLTTQNGITVDYEAGLNIQVLVNNTNTGPATININGMGPIPVVTVDGDPITPGVILESGVYTFINDGTNFQLQSNSASGVAYEQQVAPYIVNESDNNNFIDFSNGGPVTLPVLGSGFTCVISNSGLSNLTITASGGTLLWQNGGGTALPTGNRTLAPSGIVTAFSTGLGNWRIFGAGVS